MKIADIKTYVNIREDLGDLTGLASSIKAHGVLVPLTVTLNGTLIAGYRRLAAAQLAGLDEVPVHTINIAETDAAYVTSQLTENMARLDLNPIEEAQAFQLLITAGQTQREVAQTVGIAQPNVSKKLKLLKLSPKLQNAVIKGTLGERVAEQIAAIDDHTVQEELAKDPTEWRITQAVEFQERLDQEAKVIAALKEREISVATSVPRGYSLRDRYATPESLPPIGIDDLITVDSNVETGVTIGFWEPGERQTATRNIEAKLEKQARQLQEAQIQRAVRTAKVADVMPMALNQFVERSLTKDVAYKVATMLELDLSLTDPVNLVRDYRTKNAKANVAVLAALLAVASWHDTEVFTWLARNGVYGTDEIVTKLRAEGQGEV